MKLRHLGGNGKVRLVNFNGGIAVEKEYFTSSDAHWDRLGTELATYRFMHSHKIPYVPQIIAIKLEQKKIYYEYIKGETPPEITSENIAKCIDFIKTIHSFEADPTSKNAFGPASDACVPPASFSSQVKKRISKLSSIYAHPSLKNEIDIFFEDSLMPSLENYAKFLYSVSPIEYNVLSPSDFGLHNAILTENGDMYFIDFEYFGWDHPAKLISDFLLHPAMNLCHCPEIDINRTIRDFIAIYPECPGIVEALSAILPLCAINWCGIILNEFLPEAAKRREFSGAFAGLDREEVLRGQLEKAKLMLNTTLDKCLTHVKNLS